MHFKTTRQPKQHKKRPKTPQFNCLSQHPTEKGNKMATDQFPNLFIYYTTRQLGILCRWSSRLKQCTTGHSFGTYIINVQKHAQDTSVISFLLFIACEILYMKFKL